MRLPGWTRVFAKGGICLLLLALACFSARAGDVGISGVRFGQHPDRLRVVLDVGGKVDFRTSVFENPWRVVVAFADGAGQPLASGLSGTGVAPVRRYGVDDAGALALETTGPVRILDSFFLPEGEGKPPRIVIDLAPVPEVPPARGGETAPPPDPASGKADAAALAGLIGGIVDAGSAKPPHSPAHAAPSPEAGKKVPPPPPPAPRTPRTVVIDPGHGGRDPGAIGADGTFEKNITLAVAKSLRKELEKTGKYKVLLTREDDRTLRLSDRVKFARAAKADLFVSLHADSLETGQASGASLYTLSDKASDSATARLVARENRADIIAGLDLSEESEDVAGILIDLAMRETQNQSHLLSRQMVSSLSGAGVVLLDNPQRSAGFAVLKAPDVPSLLVEMGYMSSRHEVSLLKNPKHQGRLAGALGNGIESYFAWLEGVGGL